MIDGLRHPASSIPSSRRQASRRLAVALSAFAMGAVPASASPPDAQIEADSFATRVRAYLLSHPEILAEMVDALQRKELAARIAPRRAELERPYAGAWLGASDGDVVVVEFIDYACPHCRAMASVVEELARTDSKVKVVFRQLPILGRDSELAAMESLAAAEVNRFLAYHRTLWNTPDAPSDTIRAKAAAAARIEGQKSSTPVRTGEIDKNIALANALRISGTPAFVIGDTILTGEPSLTDLRAAVRQTRASRGR